MPTDALSPVPVFIMRGRGEIEVDGCEGILEFSPARVVLSLKSGRFVVCGRDLTLSDFRGEVLFVRGSIARVSFGEEGDDGTDR